MNTVAFIITQKLEAVAPIDGVSIVVPGDTASWRIQFRDDATEAQRAAAGAVLSAFDPAAAAASEDLKAQASRQLMATDAVISRCLEAGVEYPAAWRDYRAALRGVAAAGTGDMPMQPPFPEGA
ncbi:MAG: hypothetical protein PSY14_06695 [bacterium]|nr:hypothetical protein [bacterium]